MFSTIGNILTRFSFAKSFVFIVSDTGHRYSCSREWTGEEDELIIVTFKCVIT